MSSVLLRADIPFSEAQRYINVNSFGSNLCVRVTHSYIEVDIYGRTILLPGVKNSMEPRRKIENLLLELDDEELFGGPEEAAAVRKQQDAGKEKQQHYRTRVNTREIRLLINQNFDPHTAQLLTVTFQNTNSIGFKVAEEHFKRLLKELQRKYNGTKFIAVIEPHEREGYHMHVIVNQRLAETVFEVKQFIEAGVIKSKKAALTYLWPHGYFNQKPLSNGGNLGASIAEYLTKKAECPAMKYKHYFRKSGNLEPFQTLRGEDALVFIQEQRLGADLEEFYGSAANFV